MATKGDLESANAFLESQMRDKQRALNLLSEDQGCVIRLPSDEFILARANAPMVPSREDSRGEQDAWRGRVMRIIAQSVRAHGVCIQDAHMRFTSSATKST